MSGRFNLGHRRMLTGELGQLLPVGLVEVLPGDVFRHSATALVRLSPMAAPVMHRMNVRIHHFFVPHRLTWPLVANDAKFEDFITGGPTGEDAQTVPTMTVTRSTGDLLDYLGVPPVDGVPVSSLPVAAYQLVYNEWFRDQDLVPVADVSENVVQNVAWQKDYLTTARPWEQKGPEVTLPLGESAPITGSYQGAVPSGTNPTLQGITDFAQRSFQSQASSPNLNLDKTSGATEGLKWVDPALGVTPGADWAADLSQATAATVNELRRAMALQRYAEARARYGSRYAEYLRHLGVRPRDARLQRPEFLGGGSVTVSISEVLQTAPEGTDPRYGVGDMYGHGVAATRSNAYRTRFHEHGYCLSLLSVRPETMYLNGIPRTWLRGTRDEFWQKELQHIGQQAVLNNEVFAEAASGGQTFGYADRYREYREQWSQVAGEFRDVLNYWHLARDFATAPALNEDFVKCVPSKRIFNEQTQNALWIAVGHQLKARRLVSADAAAYIR